MSRSDVMTREGKVVEVDRMVDRRMLRFVSGDLLSAPGLSRYQE